MLKEFVIQSENEVVLIFDNGKRFTVWEENGHAYELYLWMMTKTRLTFKEFLVALKEEDTQVTFKQYAKGA